MNCSSNLNKIEFNTTYSGKSILLLLTKEQLSHSYDLIKQDAFCVSQQDFIIIDKKLKQDLINNNYEFWCVLFILIKPDGSNLIEI